MMQTLTVMMRRTSVWKHDAESHPILGNTTNKVHILILYLYMFYIAFLRCNLLGWVCVVISL